MDKVLVLQAAVPGLILVGDILFRATVMRPISVTSTMFGVSAKCGSEYSDD